MIYFFSFKYIKILFKLLKLYSLQILTYLKNNKKANNNCLKN